MDGFATPVEVEAYWIVLSRGFERVAQYASRSGYGRERSAESHR